MLCSSSTKSTKLCAICDTIFVLTTTLDISEWNVYLSWCQEHDNTHTKSQNLCCGKAVQWRHSILMEDYLLNPTPSWQVVRIAATCSQNIPEVAPSPLLQTNQTWRSWAARDNTGLTSYRQSIKLSACCPQEVSSKLHFRIIPPLCTPE